MRIRRAKASEAGLLTELALRSKGHWGYDSAFLEACRAELTITAQRIAAESIWVAESDATVEGFAALSVDGDEAELLDLFVEPERIGRGTGRALWARVVAEARRQGARRMRIEADPNAESWYRERGSVRVGEAPSGSIPGRRLPLLEFSLE